MANTVDAISEKFPLSPPLIAKHQQKDKAIQKQRKDNPNNYSTRTIEGTELITNPHKQIVVPKQLQGRIVAWCHECLTHPGSKVLEKTMGQTLYWDGMRKDSERYVRTCRKCQLCKKTNKNKFGQLPPKEAEKTKPWVQVNVDMIGPYTVKQPNGKKVSLTAMTMIDPATCWFEIAEVKKIDADHAQQAMDDTWLSRYPRPQFLGHDGGSELKNVFSEMRENQHGMKRCKGAAHIPQSNAIAERVHQVLGDMLRTFELEEQQLDEDNPFGRFLSACAYSVRSTYHTTLQATPAQLVFGRDMILPVNFRADWSRIHMNRQTEIMRNNTALTS